MNNMITAASIARKTISRSLQSCPSLRASSTFATCNIVSDPSLQKISSISAESQSIRPKAHSGKYGSSTFQKIKRKRFLSQNCNDQVKQQTPGQLEMLRNNVLGVTNIFKQRSWESSVGSEDDHTSRQCENPKSDDVKTKRRSNFQNKMDQKLSDTSSTKKRPKTRKIFRKNKHPGKSNKISAGNITSSEWLLVSNIPPISQLSDLLPSLTDILTHEINKGIIDLDELLKSDNTNTVDFRDPEFSHQLKEIGALESLYSTQPINPEIKVPLCKFSLNPNQSLPSQLIAEARLHLSYRARPMGWFLRFNNRSIAHAVRCHVREAERHSILIKEKFKNERRAVSDQRNDWIDGLWKSVQEDYANKHCRTKRLAEKDSPKDRKLMWGEDTIVEQEFEDDNDDNSSLAEHASTEEVELKGIDAAVNEGQERSKNAVDKFYDDYTEAHPYPMHTTTMPSVESVFNWHHLKVGSSPLRVDEFSPTSFPIKTDNKMDYWEQHSFHLASVLGLSDSCVRVETMALDTKLHEIIYLLRGYDLKSIYLEHPGVKQLPESFARLPKSIGWNLRQCKCDDKDTPQQLAVDFLLRGEDMRNFQRRSGIDGKRQEIVTPPWKHTFLIRFASSADARMAIRDMQGVSLNGSSIVLSQYPRADITS